MNILQKIIDTIISILFPKDKTPIIKEQVTMYKFSKQSEDRLNTCHPDIQKVFREVIKHVDCTIIEGSRSKERQEELVRTGKSKTMASKHLVQADGYSHAVDVMLYPIVWDLSSRNYMFIGFVLGIAASMGIELTSGSDWNGNFDPKDDKFQDLPHFQIKGK